MVGMITTHIHIYTVLMAEIAKHGSCDRRCGMGPQVAVEIYRKILVKC